MVRFMLAMKEEGYSLPFVLQFMTSNVATVLQLQHKGQVRKGCFVKCFVTCNSINSMLQMLGCLASFYMGLAPIHLIMFVHKHNSSCVLLSERNFDL